MNPLDRRSFLRAAALLALCAVSVQTGRLLERLDAASRVPPAPPAAAASSQPSLHDPEPAIAMPPQEVITPLNARDPSALVMAPYDPPPATAFVAPPPPPPSTGW